MTIPDITQRFPEGMNGEDMTNRFLEEEQDEHFDFEEFMKVQLEAEIENVKCTFDIEDDEVAKKIVFIKRKRKEQEDMLRRESEDNIDRILEQHGLEAYYETDIPF